MATKAVKVKAHKRLSGTGKIENVDAHVRKIKTEIASTIQNLDAKSLAGLTKMARENPKTPWEMKHDLFKEHVRRMGGASNPQSRTIAGKLVYGE